MKWAVLLYMTVLLLAFYFAGFVTGRAYQANRSNEAWRERAKAIEEKERYWSHLYDHWDLWPKNK